MLHPSFDRWRDWIPSDCPGCDRRLQGQGLCPACLVRLRPAGAPPRCPHCAHPRPGACCPGCGPEARAYDGVVAAFDHAGLGRDLIHAYKLRRQLSLAPVLAGLLVQSIRTDGAAGGPPDWIVPVPARRGALRWRGFSPPAEVARQLSRRLGVRSCLDGVWRQREEARQAGLSRAQRLRAQTGAFAIGMRADVAGRRIAVVDDVLTTGATLQAVAAVLKAAGAVRVDGWVLARAVDHRPQQGRA